MCKRLFACCLVLLSLAPCPTFAWDIDDFTKELDKISNSKKYQETKEINRKLRAKRKADAEVRAAKLKKKIEDLTAKSALITKTSTDAARKRKPKVRKRTHIPAYQKSVQEPVVVFYLSNGGRVQGVITEETDISYTVRNGEFTMTVAKDTVTKTRQR
jgi:cell fate (sporulation/competence/biofilm development) regulator YlbF (YheA/YmcA/DUF963 family)